MAKLNNFIGEALRLTHGEDQAKPFLVDLFIRTYYPLPDFRNKDPYLLHVDMELFKIAIELSTPRLKLKWTIACDQNWTKFSTLLIHRALTVISYTLPAKAKPYVEFLHTIARLAPKHELGELSLATTKLLQEQNLPIPSGYSRSGQSASIMATCWKEFWNAQTASEKPVFDKISDLGLLKWNQ
jgi:hypothetical protein